MLRRGGGSSHECLERMRGWGRRGGEGGGRKSCLLRVGRYLVVPFNTKRESLSTTELESWCHNLA